MLKLLSRQALKALRNPFRNPLPNPLCGPLQTRHLHTELAPFSGPPSYATIARRFSASSPSPISFFRQKAAKEAIEPGEFVDIHDIGGVDPKDYDVLITDINNDTLHSEISKLVGIPYLKEATKDEADTMATKLYGFTYGQKSRMIFPCILGYKDQARWVFFILDTGAPLTYISTQVAEAFGHKEEDGHLRAKIAGYAHPVHRAPSDSHFSDLNLLGQDSCNFYVLRAWKAADRPTVTYYIGDNWEEPRPKL